MPVNEKYKYDKKLIVDAAVEYAKRGIAVVPLLGRELLDHTLSYSKDPAEVERIFTECDKQVSVGIALGNPSGVVAITTESYLPKRKMFDVYVEENGPLPETLTILGEGLPNHHFYRLNPRFPVRGNVRITENMYVRGDGEFMALPPSPYPALLPGEFHFEDDWELVPEQLPECPRVINLLAKRRMAYRKRNPLFPGQKNATLFF
jgi:hypothetical protein